MAEFIAYTTTTTSITVQFKGNNHYNEEVSVQVKRNGSVISSQSGIVKKNLFTSFTCGGLSANTTYTCVWQGEIGYGSFTFTTPQSGSGGGSASDASPTSSLNDGYPTVTSLIGPYPIDSETYTGQRGSSQGIHWSTSGTGYYIAQITGKGDKLLTNSTSNPYTGTYDSSHHGTGDYVSITLNGDISFNTCSGFYYSVSELSTSPSAFGSWDTGSAYHTRASASLARLNGSDQGWSSHNTYGSSIYASTAVSGAGKGSHTITLPRPSTIEDANSSGKIYTYYCLQSLNNMNWGSSYKSVAAISFDVPRLDPLVSTDTDGTGSGNCEIYISNGYDTTTSSYTYDSTPYTSRYIPMDTHIKVVATPDSDSTFDGFSDSSISYTQDGNSYYFDLDVTDDISYQALFEEDLTDKAMYLNEIMTTNKSYRLVDGSAAHGSGTSGRLSKWDTAKTLTDAPVITGSTSVPSSLDNGNITAVNSENYPNDTNWVRGSGQNWGETVYACIKVTVKSETATSITYHVAANSYVTGFDGGIDSPYGSWYITENGSTKWSQSSLGYTWSVSGGAGYLASGNFYDSDITVTKGTTAKTYSFGAGIGATGYTTATVTKSFTVPAAGFGAAVGYNGSVRTGRTYVKYNDSWHDVIMWVNVNGTWIKGHYYN